MTTPRSLVRMVLTWPVESQQQARRNALVAGTALARVRKERDEVEEFLELHDRRRTSEQPPAVTARRAARG